MKCLIMSGGPLDRAFVEKFLSDREYGCVIAVDAGLSACFELGLKPALAVGDFDTFGRERAEELRARHGMEFEIHRPEKDETDTELAIHAAIRAGYHEADLLGGLGGRIDHEISNIQLLLQGKRRGLSVSLYNEGNKVSLLDGTAGCTAVFSREGLYGSYVSFLPLTETVKGITLTGFKYPLHKKDISILENPSLCVSNEVVEKEAKITFDQGILICVESRDQKRGG